MRIAFEIPLIAKPKAEKKQRRIKLQDGREFTQKYNDKDTREGMANVVALCAPYAPKQPFVEGPVLLEITCYRPMPIAWIGTWREEAAEAKQLLPATRPDWDNYAKLIGDALKNSGAWFRDDGQIVDGRVLKYFSLTPRIGIVVEQLVEIRTGTEWRAWKERAALERAPASAHAATDRAGADLFSRVAGGAP